MEETHVLLHTPIIIIHFSYGIYDKNTIIITFYMALSGCYMVYPQVNVSGWCSAVGCMLCGIGELVVRCLVTRR